MPHLLLHPGQKFKHRVRRDRRRGGNNFICWIENQTTRISKHKPSPRTLLTLILSRAPPSASPFNQQKPDNTYQPEHNHRCEPPANLCLQARRALALGRAFLAHHRTSVASCPACSVCEKQVKQWRCCARNALTARAIGAQRPHCARYQCGCAYDRRRTLASRGVPAANPIRACT